MWKQQGRMRAPRVAICVGFIRLSPTMGSCTVHLADEDVVSFPSAIECAARRSVGPTNITDRNDSNEIPRRKSKRGDYGYLRVERVLSSKTGPHSITTIFDFSR